MFGRSRSEVAPRFCSSVVSPEVSQRLANTTRNGPRSYNFRRRCRYSLLDKDGISDEIHLFNEKLREWEDYYNYDRPHGALNGETPYERLLAENQG